ncbi:hypothetical protein EI427_13140 [Flammeovirga pectinis]|uniref:DUF6787 domain-containing protein n=1 Tax=Flammeovirga pectinis TaxID=2494373 RepID=A0A3Q9FQV1_9BACT|nr:DUF6787 family protein [Flammeovirga pectinis]AZQ63150.1 hypothetical protein EI427_13140 [Flammeovirga pectinis]
MGFIDKLKKRWDVKSGGQVIVILLVFAITGTTFMYTVKPYIYPLFGITSESSTFIRILAFVFIGLPCYQVLLLIWGTILGQFKFFWAFEKRMFRRMIGKK